MDRPPDPPPGPDAEHRLADRLAAAGFIAAEEEAAELLAHAGADQASLEELVRRRLTGEPLAWITGSVGFCGLTIRVEAGVYVPRRHSEELARRAAERLGRTPVGAGPAKAIDLCTGAGAIAATLVRAHRGARVIGTDLDARAVACARANGVEAYRGDLFDPVPPDVGEVVDVVVGVVPYVPTPALPLLQRDTLTFESPLSYDGGPDGTAILRRAVVGAARFLRPGGALLVELGGDQAEVMGAELRRSGFGDVSVIVDEEGDVRGVEATRRG